AAAPCSAKSRSARLPDLLRAPCRRGAAAGPRSLCPGACTVIPGTESLLPQARAAVAGWSDLCAANAERIVRMRDGGDLDVHRDAQTHALVPRRLECVLRLRHQHPRQHADDDGAAAVC